eukprot:TRINITY_DN4794_c0_g1_i2.p1 TRINITY_DN4794_c0_g1~~TRINITY_DN4794_c0_g1_i2.p1  ORF type:complete len:177 (-),score=14.80 TRINITY_DN4794_c0_g1_i2:171-701(-)
METQTESPLSLQKQLAQSIFVELKYVARTLQRCAQSSISDVCFHACKELERLSVSMGQEWETSTLEEALELQMVRRAHEQGRAHRDQSEWLDYCAARVHTIELWFRSLQAAMQQHKTTCGKHYDAEWFDARFAEFKDVEAKLESLNSKPTIPSLATRGRQVLAQAVTGVLGWLRVM